MDRLRCQSLIGIWAEVTEKELTPVSSDVFVSIPDRDLGSHCRGRVSLRLYKRVAHGRGWQSGSADVLNG
jgi:hypothetical protein